MNVAERIMLQMQTPASQAKIAFEAIQSATKHSIVSLEELRKILMTELSGGVVQSGPEGADVHFDSIYDFVPWYTAHKQSFSPEQQTALDTLEQARGMIDAGCVCKRSSREIRAHQYFEQFWSNNKETDMLRTISNVTQANKVTINAYCSYTRSS